MAVVLINYTEFNSQNSFETVFENELYKKIGSCTYLNLVNMLINKLLGNRMVLILILIVTEN
ncbi:hypothetical protein AAJ76_1000074349 [Vairimorpha ceranae]|uniref:Uncharacterized protein n=1 Tax=Vairimorpha ceranae TaxID=40302 RepID=A0A0F9WGZ9_9MICR|nr:hypothetical protein AAJ76_1000074349 [Vairimorpha ceranae]KKO75895.1 hypothetical protein AAJ76_1000074349 [Vairimorpha ceranae]